MPGSASSWLEFSNVINWNWAKLKPEDDRLLGSFNGMFIGSLFYLVLVSALSFFMFERRRANKSFDLKYFSILHNLIMTVYSLWGGIGVAIQFFHNWKVNGCLMMLMLYIFF
jgi:hypothetical protein